MKLKRYTCNLLVGGVSLLLFIVCVTSCNHKDLEHEIDTFLKVNFDWSLCPQASPQSMRLFVFQNGSQPIIFPFSGNNGGEVELSFNTFDFVAFNSDTEVLSYRGDSEDEFEIYSIASDYIAFSQMFASTRAQLIPHANGTELQKVINEPDPLWASVVKSVRVPGPESVTMQMQSAVVSYTFTITNVENLSNAAHIAATISGMSESYIPSQQKCSDTYCIIPFPLSKLDKETITGTVRTFGYSNAVDGSSKEESDDNKKKLVVFVQTTDGEKLYYVFDITDVLIDAGQHKDTSTGIINIEVKIDSLPIPEAVGGTGMVPTVDGWQEVEIEMNL